ncbi:hypothetical protein SCUCBS95973_000142 [Sporothrix curviconia]|uniref:Uncharacterized protein n=1 Tax=Sporothrix curviconia TaxID=1260050 RepID=A0ABP0ALP0_9PEZI
MSHAHHHSYSTLQDRSSSQYNQYASSSQLAQAERRDSLSNQPQQPAAFGPSVTSSSSTGSLDKFDNVQLPPLQGVAQTMPSPPQFTVPPLASALDSSGPSSQLRVSESAAAPSHSRHQSLSSSVAYMLGPSVEPGGTHPYTSPSSHATATSPP